MLSSIRWRLSNLTEQIERNQRWHEKRAEEEDRRRELRKRESSALDSRVRTLERNKYFVLGGMAVILAIVKIAPAIFQWLTKP